MTHSSAHHCQFAALPPVLLKFTSLSDCLAICRIIPIIRRVTFSCMLSSLYLAPVHTACHLDHWRCPMVYGMPCVSRTVCGLSWVLAGWPLLMPAPCSLCSQMLAVHSGSCLLVVQLGLLPKLGASIMRCFRFTTWSWPSNLFTAHSFLLTSDSLICLITLPCHTSELLLPAADSLDCNVSLHISGRFFPLRRTSFQRSHRSQLLVTPSFRPCPLSQSIFLAKLLPG